MKGLAVPPFAHPKLEDDIGKICEWLLRIINTMKLLEQARDADEARLFLEALRENELAFGRKFPDWVDSTQLESRIRNKFGDFAKLYDVCARYELI